MKKLFIISSAVVFFASCTKPGREGVTQGVTQKTCPTVSANAVPYVVTKAFQDKHPGITAKTWFNKDDKGFAAKFDNNGKDALIFFDNNGNFQKEEIDGDNHHGGHENGENENGDHENGNDDNGCECK